MIPESACPLRTYYDPQLWNRLIKPIRQQREDKAQHLVDGRWKTLDEAREIIGYIHALDWLFLLADDLTRYEPRETDLE